MKLQDEGEALHPHEEAFLIDLFPKVIHKWSVEHSRFEVHLVPWLHGEKRAHQHGRAHYQPPHHGSTESLRAGVRSNDRTRHSTALRHAHIHDYAATQPSRQSNHKWAFQALHS